MDEEKINEKFLKADFIYIGGGDTLFMLDRWNKDNLLNKIIEAYNRGVIIAGRSAGAVCWFETMYTDSEVFGNSDEYSIQKGLGILKGVCSPHYNIRKNDLHQAIIENNISQVYAIEDDSALEFIDGKLVKSISSGGNSYKITNNSGKLEQELI
jgi:peptidase E